ncbi:MAG: hypothetical protein ACR2OX_08755 [Methyloligellaceae bacterium]
MPESSKEEPGLLARYGAAVVFLWAGSWLHDLSVLEEVAKEAPYIFGFVPAVLFALAGYGVMHLQPAVVATFVMWGVWWGLRPDNAFPLDVPPIYFWPVVGAIGGYKLAGFIARWWEWAAGYRENESWQPEIEEDLWFLGLSAIVIGLTVLGGRYVENTAPYGWVIVGLLLVWGATKTLTRWSGAIAAFRATGSSPIQATESWLAYGFAAILTGALVVLFGLRVLDGDTSHLPDLSAYFKALLFLTLVLLLFDASARMVRHIIAYLRAARPDAQETGNPPRSTMNNASASATLRSCAPFFVFLALGLAFVNLRGDTLLVFGIAPAVFCAVAGYGGMRPRTAIVTQLVLIGLWMTRYFVLDLSPHASELFIFAYYAAIAGALIVIKLADFATNGWRRVTGRGDAKMST